MRISRGSGLARTLSLEALLITLTIKGLLPSRILLFDYFLLLALKSNVFWNTRPSTAPVTNGLFKQSYPPPFLLCYFLEVVSLTLSVHNPAVTQVVGLPRQASHPDPVLEASSELRVLLC